jgi:hypothetical protein
MYCLFNVKWSRVLFALLPPNIKLFVFIGMPRYCKVSSTWFVKMTLLLQKTLHQMLLTQLCFVILKTNCNMPQNVKVFLISCRNWEIKVILFYFNCTFGSQTYQFSNLCNSQPKLVISYNAINHLLWMFQI